ncbi:MAG: AraC family transcriptional regulator [Lachnospiraceae bacterium]
MYTNLAYLNNSLIDFMDKKKPLIVGSCGTYHLFTRPRLPTYRPKGRLDFQILYIASGKAHFYFEDKGIDTVVPAGHMVVYRPKEPQKYEYFGDEQTEVYWVHFTGKDVKHILRSSGISDDMRVINTGTSLEYTRLFKQMILELQRRQPDYQEMLALLLRQLLITIHRQLASDRRSRNVYLDTEMEAAIQYFNDNYNTEINIEAYAASRGMSVSWFIRSFRQYANTTPMQYIVSIRIANAQILLETTNYNVTEIGRIVGYDNPLYFSRIFKKQKGASPSEYRTQTSHNVSLSRHGQTDNTDILS